jgi:hypothetical protein
MAKRASSAAAVEFDAEVKGISTGKKLGEDDSATVSATVAIKGNALGMPINKIIRLQKAGLCRVTIQPSQGDLLGDVGEEE